MITQTTEFEPHIIQDGEDLNNFYIGRGMRRLKREILSIEDYLKLIRGESNQIKAWTPGTYEEEDLVVHSTSVWYANTETSGEPGVSTDWEEATVNIETNSVGFKSLEGIKFLSWDEDENTLTLQLNNDVNLQLGQEIIIQVRNTSGVTISNGTPLMATGSLGNSGRITVSPFDGTSSNATKLVGVATQDILSNEDGYCVHFGKLRNVDTSMYTDGDVLYAVDDGFTNVEPQTGVKLPVAFVIHAHTNGTLMVRIETLDLNLYQPKSEALDTLLRVDKVLAAMDIAEMHYLDGNLVKIQYQNATDVNYETLEYTSGSLTQVNHYLDSVLTGITTLTKLNGVLKSTSFSLV